MEQVNNCIRDEHNLKYDNSYSNMTCDFLIDSSYDFYSSIYNYKLKSRGAHEAVTVDLHGLLVNACLATFEDKRDKLLKQPEFKTFAEVLPKTVTLLLLNRIKNARRYLKLSLDFSLIIWLNVQKRL